MINSLYSIFSTWFLFLYTSVHIINSSIGFCILWYLSCFISLRDLHKSYGFFFSFWIDFFFLISTIVSTWDFSWCFCNELPTKNIDDFEFKTETIHILLFRTFDAQKGGSYLMSNAWAPKLWTRLYSCEIWKWLYFASIFKAKILRSRMHPSQKWALLAILCEIISKKNLPIH